MLAPHSWSFSESEHLFLEVEPLFFPCFFHGTKATARPCLCLHHPAFNLRAERHPFSRGNLGQPGHALKLPRLPPSL